MRVALNIVFLGLEHVQCHISEMVRVDFYTIGLDFIVIT